jgi:DNA-binding LacI/PurR family transcriptional regulator
VKDARTGVTLQDVADRAGVSITTASRVVNDGSRRVGAHLARRVHQAVGELGYTANLPGAAAWSAWSCTTSPTRTSPRSRRA